MHTFAPAQDLRNWLVAITIGALTASAVFVRVFLGDITLTYDSWVYWEGAISLLAGHGYQDLGGKSITAWPPLYSLTLALWGNFFGLTLGSIKWFSIVMACLNGIIWARLITLVSANHAWPIKFAALLFLVLYLPETSQALLSEVIYFPLVGLLLINLFSMHKTTSLMHSTFRVAVPLTLVLLTRNQSMVLVPALLISAWMLYDKKRLRAAIYACSIAVIAWLLCRTYLDQWGAFSIQPDTASFLTELESLAAITGSMLSINRWHLDLIALSLFGAFLLISGFGVASGVARGIASGIARKPFNLPLKPQLNQQPNLPLPTNSLIFLVFACAVYFGTIVIGLALGMPINQPRWFLAFTLFIGLSCFFTWSSARRSPFLANISAVLGGLMLITYLYRAQFFLLFWPAQTPRLQHDFAPTTEWIAKQIQEVNDEFSQSSSREEAIAALAKPYSANTVRRWQGLALYKD